MLFARPSGFCTGMRPTTALSRMALATQSSRSASSYSSWSTASPPAGSLPCTFAAIHRIVGLRRMSAAACRFGVAGSRSRARSPRMAVSRCSVCGLPTSAYRKRPTLPGVREHPGFDPVAGPVDGCPVSADVAVCRLLAAQPEAEYLVRGRDRAPEVRLGRDRVAFRGRDALRCHGPRCDDSVDGTPLIQSAKVAVAAIPARGRSILGW